MSNSRRSRLISICVHQLFLLLTTELVCHVANCNYTTANEFTATHPSTHQTRRDTTSTLYLDYRQNPANVDFTEDTNVSNLNSVDFLKTNETLVVNVSATVKTAGRTESGQVFDHVTSLTYLSPGHVTNATNDSTTITYPTETGNSFNNTWLSVANDDVINTSSHGVTSNDSVTQNALVTSRLLQKATTSASKGTPVWNGSAANYVEPETLRYTTHDDNDQMITSSVTPTDHTSRHRTHILIDRGESSSNTSDCGEW